jgi:hypothetical protein
MNVKERPSVAEFEKAFSEARGNATNAAKILGICRVTMYEWIKENDEYKRILVNSRKSLLDKCVSTAQLLAIGIPKVDDAGRVIGWEEKPDGQMLRYFMSTMGRDEGFGENENIINNNINIENKLPDMKVTEEEKQMLLEIARRQ